MRRAVFLDRDGVVNRVVMRRGIPSGPRRLEEFKFLPGIAEAVSALKKLGFLVLVVTNQPDVARGDLARAELERMHELVKATLGVDDILFCPHDEKDRCSCRKPLPGMLLEGARHHKISLKDSWMVGDRDKDAAAGVAADCRTVVLDAPYNRNVISDFRIGEVGELPALIAAADKKK